MTDINHASNEVVRQITKAFNDAAKNIKKNSPEFSNEEFQKNLEKLASVSVGKELADIGQEKDMPIEPPLIEKIPEERPIIVSNQNSKLIYLNYPIIQNKQPAWIFPLRAALESVGYLVYDYNINLASQFQESDLEKLKNLKNKLIPSMCSVFKIPEDVTLPFDNEIVKSHFMKSENGVNIDSIIFKDLWFLINSSLMVVDLMNPPIGSGFIQKLMYNKLLGIPSIGISLGDYIDPWIQKYLSVIFTDEFNVVNFLPIVKGYVPLI